MVLCLQVTLKIKKTFMSKFEILEIYKVNSTFNPPIFLRVRALLSCRLHQKCTFYKVD